MRMLFVTAILLILVTVNAIDFCVEGTLEKISLMPDAASSSYPNCNYTAILKVKQILSGGPIPNRVVLVIPGFRERKLSVEPYKAGEKLQVILRPMEQMPKEFQQTQVADNNEDFGLSYYGSLETLQLKKFSNGLFIEPQSEDGDPFAWTEKPLNPQLPEESRQIRSRQMHDNYLCNERAIAQQSARDRQDMEAWHTWRDATQKACPAEIFPLKTSWFGKWNGNSFFSLSTTCEFGEMSLREQQNCSIYRKRSLRQLKHLNDFLAFHQIDLVVCILPSSDEIAVPEFAPQLKGYRSLNALLFVRELIDSGIDAVDMFNAADGARYQYQQLFQYHRNNNHPHSGLSAICGQALATYLLERKLLHTQALPGEIRVIADRYPTNVWKVDNQRFPIDSPVETLQIAWQKPPLTPNAELLIAGNSFSFYPVDRGAIGDFVSYYGQWPYYWVGGEAGASSIPGKLLNAGPALLKGKRVVVLFVSLEHLLSGDWQDITLLLHQKMILPLARTQWKTSPVPSVSGDVFFTNAKKCDPDARLLSLNENNDSEVEINIPKEVDLSHVLGIQICQLSQRQSVFLEARTEGAPPVYFWPWESAAEIVFDSPPTSRKVIVRLRSANGPIGCEIREIKLRLGSEGVH